MAVAGRTGIAHYSLNSRKWKLFGNVSQVCKIYSLKREEGGGGRGRVQRRRGDWVVFALTVYEQLIMGLLMLT